MYRKLRFRPALQNNILADAAVFKTRLFVLCIKKWQADHTLPTKKTREIVIPPTKKTAVKDCSTLKYLSFDVK